MAMLENQKELKYEAPNGEIIKISIGSGNSINSF